MNMRRPTLFLLNALRRATASFVLLAVVAAAPSLTGSLVSANGPTVALTVNVIDGGEYGHKFGTNSHRNLLTATFSGDGLSTYTLQATGHDIDKADEVSVHVNGTLVGYLAKGPNNGDSDGDVFSLPPGLSVQGTNTVEFREKVDGWKWGVKNLGVLGSSSTADVELTVGVTDPGAYGNNYGSDANEVSLTASFLGDGASTYSLLVTGFDIDQADEVTVLVNGSQAGYLSQGPNNGLNAGDTFALATTMTTAGENLIEFRQKNQGWKWGVTGLTVLGPDTSTDITLTLDNIDSGAYGNGYGTNQHPSLVTASFIGDGVSTNFLQVSGYDVDTNDEVSVVVNGYLVGDLSVGSNNALNAGDIFILDPSVLFLGDNVIEFRQNYAGETWGVTSVGMLSTDPTATATPTDVTLSVDVVNTGSYGHKFGTNANRETLSVGFNAPAGVTYYFDVTGYDIDDTNEISVAVNGIPVGHLAKGPNNSFNAGDVFTLDGQVLQSGDNVIELRQKNPGWKWGVTNLAVWSSPPGGGQSGGGGPVISLTVDSVDPGAYGNGYGTDAHETDLSATFSGDGNTTYYLQVTGYDIDTSGEVSVRVNGTSVGNLTSGPNNDLNGGDVFELAPGIAVSGQNTIDFEQSSQGEVWGVTSLGVMTSDPNSQPPPPPPPPPPGSVAMNVTINDSVDPLQVGSVTVYAVTISVSGGTAQNVQVTLPQPSKMSFHSVTGNPRCNFFGANVLCSFVSISNGGTESFFVATQANPGAGTGTRTATVSVTATNAPSVSRSEQTTVVP